MWKMKNDSIKQILLLMFASEFNIEKLADLSETSSETFEYNVGFEFRDQQGWHEVYMNLYGTIYKEQEESCYHMPFPEFGVGEEQGGEITISEWDFDEIEVFLDNKVISLITFEDLKQSLNLKS